MDDTRHELMRCLRFVPSRSYNIALQDGDMTCGSHVGYGLTSHGAEPPAGPKFLSKLLGRVTLFFFENFGACAQPLSHYFSELAARQKYGFDH